MNIAMEAVLLIIILMCAWTGYKKGLVMCIGTILAIIISLYVGDLLSDTFSPAVKPAVRPFISGYMDGSQGAISDSLDELLDGNPAGLSVEDALQQYPDLKHRLCESSFKKVGAYTSSAKSMADEAVGLSEKNGISLSSAIVDITCSYFTYLVAFILFFVLTLIVFTVLGNIFNLSVKIPDRERLNTVGGAVVGGVTGIVYCIIIAWVLKFSGALFPEEEMRHTLLTSLFLKINFLSVFLSI
ncbi:MAG: hypothetical protein GX488_06490 [Clostridiales bacterium]|nr:hypothetical protein [Clostridiales bacterium]